MSRPLLLDTCAAVWLMEQAEFSGAAMAAMVESYEHNQDLGVSAITAWEIGMLSARGRMPSVTSPGMWFKALTALESIRLLHLTPEILINSSMLPGVVHRDPADRIIVATAREHGMTIVTRDHAILDYAAQGYVAAIAC